MTDLGNGLFAIKVDEYTYGYENWNYELFYKMSEWSSGSKPIGFSFEILGTVTKDNIDFDVEPHVPSDHGMLNNQYYFRWLLFSKSIWFENPYANVCLERKQAQNNLIDKLVIIKKV